MHDKEIISTIRLALSEKIGQQRFDLWFGRTTQLELNTQVLTVLAADRFSLDWVRNHFRSDLEAVLTDLHQQQRLPCLPYVEFRVDQALRRLPTQPQSPLARPVSKSRSNSTQLSQRRKFSRLDRFVVGPGSRIAYSSCLTAADSPGSVSPLFLFGPHGVGKTHLLEGLWSSLRRTGQMKRLVYLSAEQFTGYFLEALHGSGLPNFRRKYRDADLLILDDVQFFSGKKATLIELLHTMDAVLRAGRQLVLAADRAPNDLLSLGSDIVGRMSGGLVCRMDLPDHASRREIARQMAADCKCNLPGSVLEHLAANFSGDARQIRGAINRLQASSQALGKEISLAFAKQCLEDVLRTTHRIVKMEEIEKTVCDVFGLEPRTLRSQRKSKSVSHPRMLAMWLARKYTRAALSEIGYYFGGRSHSTVVSAQKRVDTWITKGKPIELLDRCWTMEDALSKIENRLRTG